MTSRTCTSTEQFLLCHLCQTMLTISRHTSANSFDQYGPLFLVARAARDESRPTLCREDHGPECVGTQMLFLYVFVCF